MTNITLSEQRKAELRELWGKYLGEFNQSDRETEGKEINKLVEAWKKYKEEIGSESLPLEKYTSRKILQNDDSLGYYLCNFLERTTNTKFGSSKPGNANNFGVKLNDDKTYTIQENLEPGEPKTEDSKVEANKVYKEKILPLLKRIVDCSDASKLPEIVENVDYSAKQILRKMAVLDHRHDFIYIYEDSTINSLYSEFINKESLSNFQKNYEIRQAVNEILEVTNDVDSVLLSRFLWMYANTKSLADSNTPNVILYGPARHR